MVLRGCRRYMTLTWKMPVFSLLISWHFTSCGLTLILFVHIYLSTICWLWGFCRDCNFWDGVCALVGGAKQTYLWYEDCFKRSYKWRRAPHTCREWHEPLFRTFSLESNCSKSWCFLCDVWLVEIVGRKVFLVDWRVSPFRAS